MLDVLLIGPVIFWSGRKIADNQEPVFGGVLMFLGAATVIYNGANYLAKQEQRDKPWTALYNAWGPDR
jgi:hypothetical protein